MEWIPHPIAIVEMEVRGIEMYFLTVFSDNTVLYVHYRVLMITAPALYRNYFC